MIHNLLNIIKAELDKAMPDDEIRDAAIQVGHPIGVQVADTPLVALYLGMVYINQSSADTVSSEVRPQERKDEFMVNVNAPQGPFNLSKTPLEDSLTCQILSINEKKEAVKQQLMVEKKDFSIKNGQLTFSKPLTWANRVQVSYTFPGIFTVREFRQAFFIDVFNKPLTQIERLTSVINAVILTEHDVLLETFNTKNTTQHTIGNYQSAHTLRSIRLLEMTPMDSSADNPSIWSLKYEVLGMIKVIKEIIGDYGIIQKIVSPGRNKEGVDVAVNIE